MLIHTVEKLRPFSHRPHTSCLLPGTTFEVEVFPALVRIYDLGTPVRSLVKEEKIDVKGPVKNFTVFQDLEKGCITVIGEKLCYHILPNLNLLFQKKVPSQIKDSNPENLFLGVTKQLDFDQILRRLDFREIFPLWLRLGNMLPPLEPLKSKGGVFSLLEECREKIELNRPEHVLSSFQKLFLAGFRSILVPRIQDEEHQGILREGEIPHETPLHLLKNGSTLIRALFVNEDKEGISILNHLPPDFFSGKYTHIRLATGKLHLEWTKKEIRRLVFESSFNGPLLFRFSSSLKKFRVRLSAKEKGVFLSCGKPMEIKSGEVYLLDRFEK